MWIAWSLMAFVGFCLLLSMIEKAPALRSRSQRGPDVMRATAISLAKLDPELFTVPELEKP